MTNQQLLEEIRENRKEIKRLHEDFYVFEGRAMGFLSLLTIVVNFAFSFIMKNT